MAIAYGGEIGHGSGNTGSATLIVTLSAGCNTGDIIVVRAANGDSGVAATGADLSTVVDSKGNSYVVNITAHRTAGSPTYFVGIATAKCTVALAGGDTVTLTFGAAIDDRAAAVHLVTGADQTTWVDKTASNTYFATTGDAGTTGTLSQANELVFAAFGVGDDTSSTDGGVGTTMVANGSYTRLVSYGSGDGAGTTSMCTFGEYLIVSSNATQTPQCTFGASRNGAGATVTIKESTATGIPIGWIGAAG